VVTGLFIGCINGFVITKFNIPAFIMTLAVTTVARGSALLFTKGVPISGMGAQFLIIGQGNWGFMPISVLILIILFVITWILLNKTPFGRYIFAVGGNENAAVASGIRSKIVVLKAFVLDGALTATAGIVLMSRINSGQPAAGVGYEFDAITAVVVGGTSLSGGSGSIVGTIIGAVIVGIINNVQNLLNVNAYWQQIVKGLIILFAVILDVVSRRRTK
jgi:inositol transport system permease protein